MNLYLIATLTVFARSACLTKVEARRARIDLFGVDHDCTSGAGQRPLRLRTIALVPLAKWGGN